MSLRGDYEKEGRENVGIMIEKGRKRKENRN
jgi:hypothetical protein